MELLIETVENLDSPKILLAGDLMLDEFIYGDAERISPESPVPVLKVVRDEIRLGGAANVAIALDALGGQVSIVGLIGQDDRAKKLIEQLEALGADYSGVVRTSDRPTIAKVRCVGLAQHRHAQQMLRIDHEDTSAISPELRKEITQNIIDRLDGVSVLALEDYGKGFFDDESTPMLIQKAKDLNIPVIVDPHPTVDYKRYRGATLITPNRTEASIASGIEVVDDDSALKAAEKLLKITHSKSVIITMDKEGAFLHTSDGLTAKVPTRPRTVYDVTGAGDVVMATLAMALSSNCPLPKAVALSNIAGGIEVERFGVSPVTRDEIIEEIRSIQGLERSKILSREQLKEEIDRRRRAGENIVFTNGCFDMTHIGHVTYLQEAKKQGSCLVVAINSDSSVKKLKGDSRPIICEKDRAEMLSSLECVDYVTIFDEDTPEALLEMFKPDILVKGGSTPIIVGQEFVESYGGVVERLNLVEGTSTTDIIQRILKLHDKAN